MLRTVSSGNHRVGRWLFLLVASAIMLVPAVAMQITSEVNWGLEDFGAMGLMLIVAGLLMEASSRVTNTTLQTGLGVSFIILAFFAVWAELAVGIF
ncbi:hypothetical protein JN10_0828 [Altererythrobacter ishigakiensis]|uniref:Uncharacterized protein n=2 Tax=Altererythrobacter ishigakiensis TaxID=476157 RepID=A0A562UUA4_9SPHN|nr:hypothetical protein JN10_0828 [Altererythrobacter ishigakiensis]